MFDRHTCLAVAALALATGAAVYAQPSAPPQRPAPRSTEAVAFLDGLWVGPATITSRTGEKTIVTQMERIGPMLGGEIRLMEGKARDAEGKAVFNALTVFSQDDEGGIEMRSYTPGHVGSRTLQLQQGKGFVWEMKAGTGTIRYSAVVADGVWREVGKWIGPDGAERPMFEMTLKRVGDSAWPADNAAFPTR